MHMAPKHPQRQEEEGRRTKAKSLPLAVLALSPSLCTMEDKGVREGLYNTFDG